MVMLPHLFFDVVLRIFQLLFQHIEFTARHPSLCTPDLVQLCMETLLGKHKPKVVLSDPAERFTCKALISGCLPVTVLLCAHAARLARDGEPSPACSRDCRLSRGWTAATCTPLGAQSPTVEPGPCTQPKAPQRLTCPCLVWMQRVRRSPYRLRGPAPGPTAQHTGGDAMPQNAPRTPSRVQCAGQADSAWIPAILVRYVGMVAARLSAGGRAGYP